MSEKCEECGEECKNFWELLAHNHAHYHIKRMEREASQEGE